MSEASRRAAEEAYQEGMAHFEVTLPSEHMTGDEAHAFTAGWEEASAYFDTAIARAVAEASEESVRVERARLTPLWEVRIVRAVEGERDRCISVGKWFLPEDQHGTFADALRAPGEKA